MRLNRIKIGLYRLQTKSIGILFMTTIYPLSLFFFLHLYIPFEEKKQHFFVRMWLGSVMIRPNIKNYAYQFHVCRWVNELTYNILHWISRNCYAPYIFIHESCWYAEQVCWKNTEFLMYWNLVGRLGMASKRPYQLEVNRLSSWYPLIKMICELKKNVKRLDLTKSYPAYEVNGSRSKWVFTQTMNKLILWCVLCQRWHYSYL